MSKASEQALVGQLSTVCHKDIRPLFTDKGMIESVAIWWRYGRDAKKKDQVWLRRQLRPGDYSPLGLACLIAALMGARGKSLEDVQRLIRVTHEEVCTEAGVSPVTGHRQGSVKALHRPPLNDYGTEERRSLIGLENGTEAPLQHRHD